MRLKWDWRDVFVILDAAVVIQSKLPAAREAFKEVAQTDPILAPVYWQLEACYTQVMKDGRIDYRDIFPVVMTLMPLVVQWPIMRSALYDAAQAHPDIAPTYHALERVYLALTT